MLSAQELGWLVVVSCMVLGITFCLGVCIALWCRKVSGSRNKISPVTVLDPHTDKNSKMPPLHASMLLPSVTRSEFGSEPRTLSSTVTPISGLSQSYWSVGKATPPHWSTGYPKPRTPLEPGELQVTEHDAYLPLPRTHLDLPPKYATVYTPLANTTESAEMRERMARLTAHWAQSRHSAVDTTRPVVPGTQAYLQQPRFEPPFSSFDSGSSDSGVRRQTSADLGTEKLAKTGSEIIPERNRREKFRGRDSSLDSSDVGIGGRRPLVSGFGYSDPEVLNPPCLDEDVAVLKTDYQTSRGRKRQKQRRSKKEKEAVGQEYLDSRSPILGGARQKSKYGADRSTDMTLSTGVNIGQIPLIKSTIGRSQSRDSSRKGRSRERPMKRSSATEDIIQNLGIASELSDQKVSDIIAAKYKDSDESTTTISLGDSKGKTKEGFLEGKASAESFPADCVGSLGGIELQLKYQATHEQLVMTIGSAVHLPARFQSPDAKLYVKILIGGNMRYTTPTVPGTQNPEFYFTLVHRVPSSRLHSTNIRLSVCQLDPLQRRVVVGFATVQPIDLWPILHVATTTLTHNLTTRHLMLPLHDSTPQHQVECGGNITLGLIWQEQTGSITISCVTLQDVKSSDMIDTGNSLVYLKATVYRGKELLCWRRSQPVLLNRQRTHVVNQMLLKIHQLDDLSPSPTQESSKLSDRMMSSPTSETPSKLKDEKVDTSRSEVTPKEDEEQKESTESVDAESVEKQRKHKSKHAIHPVPEIRVHSYQAEKKDEGLAGDVKKSAEEKHISAEEQRHRRSKLHLPVPKEYDTDSSGGETSKDCYKLYSDDHEKLEALPKKRKRRQSESKKNEVTKSESMKPEEEGVSEKKTAEEKTDDSLSAEKDDVSLTEYIENIFDGAFGEESKAIEEGNKDGGKEEAAKEFQIPTERKSNQFLAPGSDPQSPSDDPVRRSSRSQQHPPLQYQVSTEDESQSDSILLVLSLRLKTLRRGGRCILGTVQLGDNATTPQGRSHWRRAAASTLVPAAGTHALTHQ